MCKLADGVTFCEKVGDITGIAFSSVHDANTKIILNIIDTIIILAVVTFIFCLLSKASKNHASEFVFSLFSVSSEALFTDLSSSLLSDSATSSSSLCVFAAATR